MFSSVETLLARYIFEVANSQDSPKGEGDIDLYIGKNK